MKKGNITTKKIIVMLCVLIVFILVFFLISLMRNDDVAPAKEELIERGEMLIKEDIEKTYNYPLEILSIEYVPSKAERLWEQYGEDLESDEEADRAYWKEEIANTMFYRMCADWHETDGDELYRQYYLLSTSEEKGILNVSEQIPLADSQANASNNSRDCEEAEGFIKSRLKKTGEISDESITTCRVDAKETENYIEKIRGTEEAILNGWTKEFLENRLLIVSFENFFDGDFYRHTYYVMTKSLKNNQWEVADSYEAQEGYF